MISFVCVHLFIKLYGVLFFPRIFLLGLTRSKALPETGRVLINVLVVMKVVFDTFLAVKCLIKTYMRNLLIAVSENRQENK